jgi:hypothetical protein
VQIYGRHYHNAPNANARDEGEQYVRYTLMKALASKKMLDLGVSYPVLINPDKIEEIEIAIPVPKRKGDTGNAGKGGGGAILGVATPGATASPERKVQVRQFRFRVQFVWQPKSAAERATQSTEATGPVAAAPATAAPPPSANTPTNKL